MTRPVIVHMTRADHPAVLAIDAASYPRPWPPCCLIVAGRSTGQYVAVRNGTVIGYTVFRVGDRRTHVLRLAVAPHCRRTGVGTALLLTAMDTLAGRRAAVTVDVGGGGLEAHLWLQRQGFTGEVAADDLYRFTFEPLAVPAGEGACRA